MAITFGSNFTHITYRWTDWKAVQVAKKFTAQYHDDGSTYTIYAYDGNDVHYCQIFKNEVPYTALTDYTQEQNDLDKSDFETNLRDESNKPLTVRSAIGAEGSSPAKGLGGFAPDPANNPYQPAPDEVVSLYADAWGQLMMRGTVITDEGSLRDDFVGSALETDLTGVLTFVNGSTEVSGSSTLFTDELNRDFYVKLKSDVSSSCWTRVIRAIDDETLLLASPYQGSSATGIAHKSRWITYTSGSFAGSASVGSSEVIINSSTGSSATTMIYREGDFLPCITTWRASLSQRRANQTSHLGVRDDRNDPSMYAEARFTGTDNTLVTFVTAWNKDEETSTVSLPAGLTSSDLLRYKIDVASSYCSLLVNGVLISKHENHIPDMYAELFICAGIENSGTGSNTNLVIDTVHFANTDNVQVSSMFSEPLPVVTSEDQHNITGVLTTTLTTANQTILSYTVPAGRVLYLIGYLVDAQGTANGIFKIGKNSVSSDPAAPGVVDGNVFRTKFHVANTTYAEEFGGNPRRLGVGGDTILVTVTPDSLLSTKWRCAFDFVLR